MPTLERLEKGRNNSYAKAFNELKTRNENLYFYTPSNKVTVTGKCFNLDAVPRHRIPC
jgi:hypothetical protein